MTPYNTCFMMTAMQRSLCRLSLLFLILAGSFLACNLPAGISFGATPTPSITPTATVTPTPTLTPTPIPSLRLENAQMAYFSGDWDRALIEYKSALLQSIDTVEQATAQLGIGVTLVAAGRFQEAIGELDLFIASYPNCDRLGQGYYHRARAHEALGYFQEAAQDYQQYLAHHPGLIDSFIGELRGDALIAAGEPSAAVIAFEEALQAPHLGDGLGIEIKIARAYDSIGNYTTALAKYTDIYERSSSDYTKAQMDFLRGQVYFTLGQVDQAYTFYLHAVENYPRSYDTYIGLVALVEAGVPVNELDRGLVDYFAGQYGVALAAFNRYLIAVPIDHDDTVYYYRGLTLRALGEYANAVGEWDLLIETHPWDRFWDQAWEQKAYTQWAYMDQYGEAAQTLLDFVFAAPEHTRAAEFLYDAARITERSGQLEQAAQLWERLGTDYPDSEWTFRGLFLAGITRYRLNDFEGSRATFQRSLEVVGDSSDRAAVYLWTGKSYQAQGDVESAQAAWHVAVEADPYGYYALRAEDLLAGREPFQPSGVFNFNFDLEAERQEAEDWMRDMFPITGPEPLSGLDLRLAQDPRMVRGEELWQLGLFNEAKAEFESLREEVANDAEATYRLMHRFLELGLSRSAIYTAWQILHLAGVDDSAINAAPVYFSHIRFGSYFGELILPEVLNHDLDGLFLLSVIRQESLFESFATSYAAARGLMQIIPSTGQSLANQLGWPPNYSEDDLYRPVVSVRLGSHYMATQRDLFNGDLFAALAAYNAGPGNALLWKQLAPDDPDLFLEVIRLNQPRDYIRAIYWAFTNYCILYVE